MTDRKLASIRKIKAIEPIPGADRIVKATVDGWELVTQKSNNFQPGDLVVYFEIDSLLPICEQFSFLEPYKVSAKNSVNGEGYRLKTIRLRRQVSQGLILPLFYHDGKYFLPNIGDDAVYEVAEGDDVTDLLGVQKYEKPIPAQLAGKIRGNFPSFIRKTDQERIQNCFEDFYAKYLYEPFEVSLKLDGSSFTAYFRRSDESDLAINSEYAGTFGVCSRNLDLIETEDNAFWQVARKYDLESKLRKLGRSIAIQAELMGPGVQSNREQLEELDIYVFDIFDIDTQSYLTSSERIRLCTTLGLKHVPLIDIDTVFSGFLSVKDFLRYADRESMNNEVVGGIVFKGVNGRNCSYE